jgi:hypothetical protein
MDLNLLLALFQTQNILDTLNSEHKEMIIEIEDGSTQCKDEKTEEEDSLSIGNHTVLGI